MPFTSAFVIEHCRRQAGALRRATVSVPMDVVRRDFTAKRLGQPM
jgi:hypothetical protein